jgi:hypothetical protein
MTEAERCKLIAEFVHTEKYLKGMQYRVRCIDGVFTIEFKVLANELRDRLRSELDRADCKHIQIAILGQQKRKRRRKRKGMRPEGYTPEKDTAKG